MMDKLAGDNLEEELAVQDIIRGSFQVVASRLLSQNTQEIAGQREMYDGVNALAAVRAKRRQKWVDEARAARAQKIKKQKNKVIL